jgi:hypothetical protein
LQTSWLKALRASFKEAGQHMTRPVEKLCETFVYNSISFARFTGIALEYLRFSTSKERADGSTDN